MARIHFDGEGEGESYGESHVSKPVKRMRWASRHMTGESAMKKRMSVIKRFHKRASSAEEKQHNEEALPNASDPEPGTELQSRTVYVNVPVPEDARDEDGHVKQHFGRNKIRTAKYTPLSFVPKNLWFQFHNIANVYFLFIIILGVCRLSARKNDHRLPCYRYSPSSAQQTQVSALYHCSSSYSLLQSRMQSRIGAGLYWTTNSITPQYIVSWSGRMLTRPRTK
jgi:Phospholipid-translocating ATPase N-terminal